MRITEMWGARHTPNSVAYDTNTDGGENITILSKLQELRDIALYKSIKHRFDPVLGLTHDEYLQELNQLVERLSVWKMT